MDFMPGHQMLQNTSWGAHSSPSLPPPSIPPPLFFPCLPPFSLQLTTIYHLARSFPLDYLVNICFIG